jgi:hypothetical protein
VSELIRHLSARFSALPPTDKALFLARVAHMATVAARDSYAQDYEHPSGVMLRTANEFVHRVTGYIPHVLYGSEGKNQDASVMVMIDEYFQAHRLERWLPELLGMPT